MTGVEVVNFVVVGMKLSLPVDAVLCHGISFVVSEPVKRLPTIRIVMDHAKVAIRNWPKNWNACQGGGAGEGRSLKSKREPIRKVFGALLEL